MKFEELYKLAVVEEATFRKSKYIEHLADFPMFSVFISKSILEKPDTTYNMEFFRSIKSKIGEMCTKARNEISKIGFPKMHVNVVIDDLTESNAGGLAYGGRHKGVPKGHNKSGKYWKGTARKYLKINLNHLLPFNKFTTDILVHEWAHVWMFNNSKQFKDAVDKLYTHLLNKGRNNLNYERPKRGFGDRILNDEDDEDLYSSIIRNTAKIFQDNYQLTLVSLQTPDDNPHKFGEQEIQKFIQEDFRKLIINCVKFYNDRSGNYQISIQEYGTQLADLAKELYETVGTELLKAINKSISDDISEFDSEYHENPPEDIYEYMLQNATKTNETFRTKGKSYSDLYNNVSNVDYNSDIIDKIFDSLWDISHKERETENMYELARNTELGDEKWDHFRNQVAKLVEWINEYGMSNDRELWATAIEHFFKLPMNHRKTIIKLITQNR